MNFHWVAVWLDAWGKHTPAEHLMSAVAGLVGSGIYMSVNAPKLVMPSYDKTKRTLTLGFVGTVVIGVGSAIVVDYAFPVGVVAAVIAPTTIGLTTRVLLPGVAKVLLLWAENRAGVSPPAEHEVEKSDENP